MGNFLKTLAVFHIAFWIVEFLFSFIFPNAAKGAFLGSSNMVSLDVALFLILSVFVAATVTFLIFTSDDTLAYLLTLLVIFSLYGWLIDGVSFMSVAFCFVREGIAVGLAKVLASKIRAALSGRKN